MNTYTITQGSYGTIHAWPSDEAPQGITLNVIKVADRKAVTKRERKFDFAQDERPAIPHTRLTIAAEDIAYHERPAVPLWQYPDDDSMEAIKANASEHRRIVDYNLSSDMEGIFAVAEHLGEGIDAVTRYQDPDPRFKRGGNFLVKKERMGCLDRIIYDEFTMAAGKVVAPHEVVSDGPYFLKASYLMRRIKDLPADWAEQLAGDLAELNPTAEMVERFIGWLNIPGKLSAGIEYFRLLAEELKEVTVEGDHDLTFLNNEEDESEDEPAPSTIAYHLVDRPDLDGPDPENTEARAKWEDEYLWINRQPASFRKLLDSVKAAQTISVLGAIGKDTYNSRLSKDQTSVFWGEYKKRKRELGNVRLGSVAQNLIREIQNRSKGLSMFGKFLWNVQHKKAKIAGLFPSENEWAVIWTAYKTRQAELTH